MTNHPASQTCESLLGDPTYELRLRELFSREEFPVTAAKCTVGSAPACDVRLPEQAARPVEAVILRGAQGTIVRRRQGDAERNEPFDDLLLRDGATFALGALAFQAIVQPTAVSRRTDIARPPAGGARMAAEADIATPANPAQQDDSRHYLHRLDELERRLEQLAADREPATVTEPPAAAQLDELRQAIAQQETIRAASAAREAALQQELEASRTQQQQMLHTVAELRASERQWREELAAAESRHASANDQAAAREQTQRELADGLRAELVRAQSDGRTLRDDGAAARTELAECQRQLLASQTELAAATAAHAQSVHLLQTQVDEVAAELARVRQEAAVAAATHQQTAHSLRARVDEVVAELTGVNAAAAAAVAAHDLASRQWQAEAAERQAQQRAHTERLEAQAAAERAEWDRERTTLVADLDAARQEVAALREVQMRQDTNVVAPVKPDDWSQAGEPPSNQLAECTARAQTSDLTTELVAAEDAAWPMWAAEPTRTADDQLFAGAVGAPNAEALDSPYDDVLAHSFSDISSAAAEPTAEDIFAKYLKPTPTSDTARAENNSRPFPEPAFVADHLAATAPSTAVPIAAVAKATATPPYATPPTATAASSTAAAPAWNPRGNGWNPPKESSDEESIEDYMNRLLARVRGNDATPAPRAVPTPDRKPITEAQLTTVAAATPAPTDVVPTVTPAAATASDVEPALPIPTEPEVPRRPAPEKSASLAAMRELANSSAHQAIASHAKKNWVNMLSVKPVVAGFVMAALAGSFAFLRGNLLLMTASVLTVIGVTGYWIVQVIRYRQVLLRSMMVQPLSHERSEIES